MSVTVLYLGGGRFFRDTSKASVTITALLYNGPLLGDFNVGIKGLSQDETAYNTK